MNLQKGWKELQSKQRTKSMRKIDKIFADKNKNEWILFLEILESFENYYLPTYLPRKGCREWFDTKTHRFIQEIN